MTNENNNDKPVLLKAVELVLADPKSIQDETKNLIVKYNKKYQDNKSDDEIIGIVVNKIISNYSYYAAFAGGATALTGVVPGLGTAISTFGGGTADAALSMKYQIEMTMAIAVANGHNILTEEGKRICLIVAGLGAASQAAKKGGHKLTSKAFIKMTKQYLQGTTLQIIKDIFKKIGINFTKKAAVKAIPFGVGVIIGFTANKGLTWYVGSKARDFFEVY